MKTIASRFARISTAASLIWSPVGFAKGIEISVSGDNGIRDEDGRPSYSPGDTPGTAFFGRGANGDDGGNAVEVREGRRLRKKGWDGGTLNLLLSVNGDSQIIVSGEKTESESTAAVKVTKNAPFERSSRLRFFAKGGRGGDGGNGGRGQDGGQGATGTPSVGRTPGGDGHAGGSGGDEGDSTDGGDAGAGGDITLRVPIRDMDLAMLIDERDVSGNRGGDPGVGQGPGEGGAGGWGGASGSYTTIETRTVETGSTTDDDGNTTTTYGTEEYEETHFVPGGSSGPSGPDGSPSRKQVYEGAASQPGVFKFEVQDEQGKVTAYDEPYWVQILPGFTLTGSHNGEYKDREGDFFEPGETITIRGLRIKNVGKSPTPKYQKVKLFIADNDGRVRTHGDEIFLPRAIGPGETYDFGDEAISFHLAEKKVDVAGRLEESETVAPRGLVTRIEEEFHDISARSKRTVRVQYPIRITPLTTLTTIAPGEAMLAEFLIENVSEQTIGGGLEADGLRYAHTEFKRTEGSLSAQHFVMSEQDDRGAVDPNEGIRRAIIGMKPGEKRLVRTYVGFRPDAKIYTKVSIQPELFLESILKPNEINRIQYEPYVIRVSEVFNYTKAPILLISNAGLDDKVLDGLKTVAKYKQLRVDTWDFSKYGYFNFQEEHLDHGRFFEMYRGKTIIILGNPVKLPGGTVSAHQMLSPNQVIEASRRFGVKIVVIDPSDDPVNTVERLTEPLPRRAAPGDESDVIDVAGPKAYVKDVRTKLQTPPADDGEETTFLGVTRYDVHHTPWWPWTGPTEAALAKAGLDALNVTESYLPETRAYVDYYVNHEPPRVGSVLGLWPTWNLGRLEISQSVDDASSSVIVVTMPRKDLENPRFITGEQFSNAFDTALNIGTRVDLLNEIIAGDFAKRAKAMDTTGVFVRPPMEYAQILMHSLFLDVVQESNTIRPLNYESKVTKAQLWDKLNLLKRLTHHSFDQFKLDPNSEEGQLLVNWIVAIRFYNRGVTSWFERVGRFDFSLTPTHKNVQVSQVTVEMLERLITTVFADVPEARRIIESKLAGARAEAKAAGFTRQRLKEFIDPRGIGAATTRDAQGNVEAASRVRGPQRQDDLLRLERWRLEQSGTTKTEVAAETLRLRVKNDACATLLASQHQIQEIPHDLVRQSAVPKVALAR